MYYNKNTTTVRDYFCIDCYVYNTAFELTHGLSHVGTRWQTLHY